MKAPRVVKVVEPSYPLTAERLKRKATVKVEALVDETGKVVQVRFTQPDASKLGFNESAEKAARETPFEPATKDGVEVKMWYPLTFAFTAQEKVGR